MIANKSLLEIYALTVCFAMVLWGVLTISSIAADVVSLAVPQWDMALMSGDNQFASNEAYCDRNPTVCGRVKSIHNIESGTDSESRHAARLAEDKYDEEQKEQYGPDAITKKREAAYNSISGIRHAALGQYLIVSLFKFFVLTGVFCLHWRIGRKIRESQSAAG